MWEAIGSATSAHSHNGRARSTQKNSGAATPNHLRSTKSLDRHNAENKRAFFNLSQTNTALSLCLRLRADLLKVLCHGGQDSGIGFAHRLRSRRSSSASGQPCRFCVRRLSKRANSIRTKMHAAPRPAVPSSMANVRGVAPSGTEAGHFHQWNVQ